MLFASYSLNDAKLCPISPEQVEFIVCIDAAFVVHKYRLSHAGILSTMRNKLAGTVNVLRYLSLNGNVYANRFVAAELFALCDGVDIKFTIAYSSLRS